MVNKSKELIEHELEVSKMLFFPSPEYILSMSQGFLDRINNDYFLSLRDRDHLGNCVIAVTPGHVEDVAYKIPMTMDPPFPMKRSLVD